MEGMKTWYFTFGWGQSNAGCTQPIKAENAHAARLKMMEQHGRKWSFQYSEEDYRKSEPLRGYKLLPTLTVSHEEAEELYIRDEVPA